jgi:hypothetical protein
MDECSSVSKVIASAEGAVGPCCVGADGLRGEGGVEQRWDFLAAPYYLLPSTIQEEIRTRRSASLPCLDRRRRGRALLRRGRIGVMPRIGSLGVWFCSFELDWKAETLVKNCGLTSPKS